MPATVFVLGLLSIALLVWNKQIKRRQVMNFAVANAVMDLRIKAATSHVWVEEAISGGGKKVEARALADLREATRLSDVLLNGGVCENGLIAQPAEDPELRRRAESIRRLVSEWGAITRERIRAPEAGGEGSALENRSDEVSDELQRKAAEMESIIETDQAADLIQSRRLFYGLLVAWSFIVVASTTALLHRERKRSGAEEALRSGKDELEMRVAERTTELRHLSARLLTAQETERRRISTELHDELGHSLILMKFRSGLIAKELRDDQSAAREECRTLSGSIDQTIEDVRRLSRDLRPSILEELGLSATLRWLANNCRRDGHDVAATIGEVDHLVSSEAQVVLYRIIQQALTNASKHSAARHVALSVERRGDRLSLVVEDDGEGFDVNEAVMRSPSERGLGLATMQERAWMLGGSLSVWSEKGKGTRITLGVPLQEGKA
jgi:signal transduction histidine kinase